MIWESKIKARGIARFLQSINFRDVAQPGSALRSGRRGSGASSVIITT